ncbi:MAG: hypothetical protein ABIO70_06625 [Pseudomonadota bacterium]
MRHLPWLLPLTAALGCTPTPRDSTADSALPEDPCVAPEGAHTPDPWGGDLRVSLEATGFFRTEKLCDRWWLVTPEGHPIWSFGVNSVNPHGDTDAETGEQLYAEAVAAIYGSDEAWAEAETARLKSWGLNTTGAWSTHELTLPFMAATPILYIAGYDWLDGTRTDWFDPAWPASVEQEADALATSADEPNILGWFLDNEISWGPDWRGLDTLLQAYLEMGAEAPGKAVAVDFLLEQLGGVEAVNSALGTAFADRDTMLAATGGWDALDQDCSDTERPLTAGFLSMAAEHYFSTVVTALRARDPNHLILGNREVSVLTRLEVYEAAARHVDVLSINNYRFRDGIAEGALDVSGGLDPADGFAALAEHVDLPILISEFGFRAADSGLPNSWPFFYPTYDTQTERADAFEAYAREHQAQPLVVGYHWFEWVDQPQGGRSLDGEDNNWGLVNQQDEIYEELTERMSTVNAAIFDELRVPRE